MPIKKKADAQPPKKKRGRPKSDKVAKSANEIGTLPGEQRATFIVQQLLLEKIKALAYWRRLKIKDVLNQALQEYIDRQERQERIKPKP